MQFLHGDTHTLFRLAADLIAGAARRILATQAQVVLALPGGRSAADVFDELAKAELPWAKIHVFMADERFVPLDHPDSNFRLVAEHLAAPLAKDNVLPHENVHPFVVHSVDAQSAVAAYSETLARLGGKHDIALLSVGADGHIASLFPRTSVLDNAPMHALVANAPKPPPQRMTISRELLLRTHTAVLLCIGDGKRDAYKTLADPAADWRDCPARLAAQLPETYVLGNPRA
jgi:6-phosphogluconolactonase